MVAGSQEVKCRLKYVIYSQGDQHCRRDNLYRLTSGICELVEMRKAVVSQVNAR